MIKAFTHDMLYVENLKTRVKERERIPNSICLYPTSLGSDQKVIVHNVNVSFPFVNEIWAGRVTVTKLAYFCSDFKPDFPCLMELDGSRNENIQYPTLG